MPKVFQSEEDYKNDTYTIEQDCISSTCDTVKTITVAGPELFAYNQGKFVQQAFPTMSADDREFFFISGLCSKCWDEMLGDEE